jgi:hypothetical protein
MPTPEDLTAFAERLHAQGRAAAANNKRRRAAERIRLAGHSTCPVKHDHYRADCCPRCTERWGDLPQDAPSVPFESFSDHERANYTEADWALVAQLDAEWSDYLANWTPENCRHEFCAITDDNREICEWCGRDVTEPDFPVAEVEIARERAADYDRRMAERAGRPDGEKAAEAVADGAKDEKFKVVAYQAAPKDDPALA